MATVAWIDIAEAAYQAGWRGEAHAIAVALTQPESGRQNDAVNESDPNGGSFGLWQINGVHDPNASGVYPNKVPTQAWIDLMFTPAGNAQRAYKVWLDAGKSFKPWGAFTSNLHMAKTLTPFDVAKIALDGRSRLAAKDATITSLQSQRSALTTQVATLTLQLEEARNALVTLGNEKDAEIARVLAEKNEALARAATLEGEKQSLANEISALHAKAANARVSLSQALSALE